jgi:hypothetical protein
MPLAVADLQGDISTAAKKLAAALDQLKSVRPTHLDELATKNTAGTAAKNGKKKK